MARSASKSKPHPSNGKPAKPARAADVDSGADSEAFAAPPSDDAGDGDFAVDRPIKKRRGGRKSAAKPSLYRSPIAGILDELSDELLQRTFELLDPPDLLAVARASKRTYAFVMSRDRQLFHKAFARLEESDDPPPRRPDGFSLPQWAAMLYAPSCMTCQEDQANIIFRSMLAMNETFCVRCMRDKLVSTGAESFYNGHVPLLSSKMPELDRRAVLCVDSYVYDPSTIYGPAGSYEFYRIADLEEAARNIERIFDESADDLAADATLESMVQEQRTRTATYNMTEVGQWQQREETRNEDAAADRRACSWNLLFDEIDRRLVDLVVNEQDLADLPVDNYTRVGQFFTALGLSPAAWRWTWDQIDISLFDLTPRVWQRLKPTLMAAVKRNRLRRIAAEAKMQREFVTPHLAQLYARIIELDKTGSGPIPPARVLFTIDTFRSALVNLEGKARTSLGDLTDAEIVAAIETWRRRIILDLAKLVDEDATAETAGEVMQQVRAVFQCRNRKCSETGGGLTLTSAYDHKCLERELAFPFPDFDEDMAPSRQLEALPCEEIACAVVDAVGFDPDVARLDDVEDQLFLLDVTDERRISRHLRDRISSQPHSFADLIALLVELDDEALAVSIAANTRMGWAVERTPLTIDPVEADWDEADSAPTTRRRARTSSSVSDDIDAPPSRLAPLDVPVIERGSDRFDKFAAEPGTTTHYGCRLCTTLVPTTQETVAWTHVLRAHARACLPADDAIFAVRCPLPVDD